MNAVGAASRVGHESPSQFSHENRRIFRPIRRAVASILFGGHRVNDGWRNRFQLNAGALLDDGQALGTEATEEPPMRPDLNRCELTPADRTNGGAARFPLFL